MHIVISFLSSAATLQRRNFLTITRIALGRVINVLLIHKVLLTIPVTVLYNIRNTVTLILVLIYYYAILTPNVNVLVHYLYYILVFVLKQTKQYFDKN